jgi:hypothetical protein
MKIRRYIVYSLLCLIMLVASASCKDSSSNNSDCIKVSGNIVNYACNITDTTSYVYNYASCAGYNVSVTVVPSMACDAVSETVINMGPVLGGGNGYTLKLDQERIAAWTVSDAGESITTIANKYGLTVESIKTTYNSGVPTTVNGAYITIAILDIPQGHTLSEYLTSYGETKPFCTFGNDPKIQFATPVYDVYGLNSTVTTGYVSITDQFQVWFTTTSITPQFNQPLNVGLEFSYSTGNTLTWLLETTKKSPGNALDMVMLYTSSGFSCGETDWQTVHLQ